MKASSAIGYDVVFQIDPAVYEVTRTGDGTGYAFRMDDETRQQLAAGVQEVLDRPQDVTNIDLHPGYVRVQLEPPEGTSPKDIVDGLRGLVSYYNRHCTQTPDLDGLQFADRYVAAYHPDGALTAEQFLEEYTGTDVAPESNGPVFVFDRDAGPDEGGRSRHLAYEYIFPIDAEETYGTPTEHGTGTIDFEWDSHVLGVFDTVVEDVPAWPGSTAEEIARVAIYPEYVTVYHSSGALRDPTEFAEQSLSALKRFNSYRGEREEFGLDHQTVRQPPISFTESAYICPLSPTDGGTGAWIEAHNLDDEDGEPREPDAEAEMDVDVDVDDDGGWSIPNPFKSRGN